MFRHPKYYKELRKRNKVARGQGRSNSELTDPASISDQVISGASATAPVQRAPGPGQQHQASSVKLKEPQASSGKHQAPSSKHQA